MDILKQAMHQNNYFVGKIDPLKLSPQIEQEIQILNHEFAELPVDSYAPDSGRFRSMLTGYIDLKQKRVIFHAGMVKDGKSYFPYYQGAFNPEVKSTRYFESVSHEFKQTKFISNLLLTDLDITGFTNKCLEDIVLFEVQLIKFIVNQNRPIAKCSPQVMHQDGNRYAIAHLMKRENIDSAFNCIGNINCVNKDYDDVNQQDILTEFTIYDFMDSYGCDDATLAHYVSDICLAQGATSGTRSIMTVAFFDTLNSFKQICPGIHESH